MKKSNARAAGKDRNQPRAMSNNKKRRSQRVAYGKSRSNETNESATEMAREKKEQTDALFCAMKEPCAKFVVINQLVDKMDDMGNGVCP